MPRLSRKLSASCLSFENRVSPSSSSLVGRLVFLVWLAPPAGSGSGTGSFLVSLITGESGLGYGQLHQPVFIAPASRSLTGRAGMPLALDARVVNSGGNTDNSTLPLSAA